MAFAGCATADDTPANESATTTTTTTVAPAPIDTDTDADPPDLTEDVASRWPQPLSELDPSNPPRWAVAVVERFDHDADAFTQGLETLSDGFLLESTGLTGESTIRIVDPSSGDPTAVQELPAEHFGEGATLVGDTVVQLTWKAGVAHRWAVPSLAPLDSWSYDGEGWGLCLLGEHLVMSNGSSRLFFRDPDNFAVVEEVVVTFMGNEVSQLNELECVDGHIVANIWPTSTLLVIRPDGIAVASIDGQVLTDEVAVADPTRAVLNGVAVRDDATLWLTGKLWPTLFAVQVIDG